MGKLERHMSSPTLPRPGNGAQSALYLGALGVVFGDIGTSPLYTMKQCLAHLPTGIEPAAGLLGILSLIFWTLILVVSVKYVGCVMRADNHGEGGIFALLGLLHPGREAPRRRGLGFSVVMILAGAALLYGDGIITPAISVLGAAEGLAAVSPKFTPAIIAWIACGILAVLFWLQHRGTKQIGGIFGPIMLIWFTTLAVLGAWQIYQYPQVLRALDPRWGLALIRHGPVEIAGLLGATVLAITGAEALYADMGHFGRKFIGHTWHFVVLPGLLLNYFGQGAFVLSHPAGGENPFFALAAPGLPRALLTAISIVAAIIASQALISGAYSLTRQAIQLGYFPRLKITYTNPDHSGQIYVPFVNTLLAIGSILTVGFFGSTDRLAAAYGIAVTGTMAITSVAYFFVARKIWTRANWLAGPVCGFFLFIDLTFFVSNAHKFTEGGWFPLAIGAAVLAVMYTWKIGRQEIFHRVYSNQVTEEELAQIARSKHVTRVGGSAVFMVGSPKGAPITLLHHVKANRCLHQVIVLLSIMTEEVPTISAADRLTLIDLGEGMWRAIGKYGYMESPNVSKLLNEVRERGVPIHPESATYFFNREMIITDGSSRLWKWQKSLYAFLSRNARPVKDYYRITPSQIIEIGLPIQL